MSHSRFTPGKREGFRYALGGCEPRSAFMALRDSWRLQLSGTCELWPKLTVERLRTPEASVVTAPRLTCPTAPFSLRATLLT
jgi:hypothetical protein